MESTNSKALFEVAEIQLSYKSKVKACDRPKINSSRDAYNVLRNQWDENRIEFVGQFKVLLLNRANKVIRVQANLELAECKVVEMKRSKLV